MFRLPAKPFVLATVAASSFFLASCSERDWVGLLDGLEEVVDGGEKPQDPPPPPPYPIDTVIYYYDSAKIVAHYRLDGDAYNSVGAGLHGTIHGNPIAIPSRSGRPGTALLFDGEDDYIVVENSAKSRVDFDTEDFSVVAWVATTVSTQGYDVDRDEIISKGDAYNTGYAMSLYLDRFSAYVGSIGWDGHAYNAPQPINDGQWHCVAMVRRGAMVELYVDARMVYMYRYVGTASTDMDLIIGRHGYKSETFFNGAMDEISIYRGALGYDRIVELAQ